ncbi:short chain dehydrogenase family protein [Mycolicibacterium hassiacum DSM 44199]|uniref:Short chain dehydrogenase family protein n=2 Tax=Mycolicibacterium hassiacum TaxID=46351 RepID=K5BFJ9_MYCHD|nr:mycobactin polyketide synthase MbtD [Mycolicibacterium hassiacum]EKF23211.1 short chain dehydrogenase family protein [Mycolicibacterium hassiacum DSM 44199]MDA4085556.1 polyketide synthase [Mycolicibacterium hassiacum DSM 44199]VCT89660.1 6-deoxyerythronolide-B synthase EryA1, modules 1 and 2 [Mycolicibacterium hassiacum DSM 44199]
MSRIRSEAVFSDGALPDGRVAVVLSAHAEELLGRDAAAITAYLERHPQASPAAVAATVLRTRRIRRHRAVLRAGGRAELLDALRAVQAGQAHPLVARSSRTSRAATAFVFPGQGNQWPSMGAEAYRRLPGYRAAADACAAAFTAAGHPSPLPYLTTGSGDWSQTEIQGAQFTHAVGLAQVWRSVGIRPDYTIGHSLGEVAAAYVAGAIALPDAVAVVAARARAVERLAGGYAMAVLATPVGDAEALIAETRGWLEISAVNADASVVIAGERTAVADLVAAAERRGVFARLLDVDYPGHTSALERVRDDLLGLLPAGEFAAAPFIGSTTGEEVPAGTGFADYWYRNLRDTVRFDRAVGTARRRGAGVFIEMSAHPSLLVALGDLVGDEAVVIGSGQRDAPFADTLAANIATAAAADPQFTWPVPTGPVGAPLRGFPNAPMRDVHLWAMPKPLPPVHRVVTAAERWDPVTHRGGPVRGRRIAVVELAVPGSPLAGRLRAAVTGRAELADPAGADLLIAVAPLLDHPDPAEAVDRLADLLGAGLLDYADHIGTACREVWLLTVGGEQVRAGEPVALPAQAALAAMHRSLGFEHPEQAFRHLDLPSWDIDAATAVTAVDAVLGPPSVHELALRETSFGPQLFVRTPPEDAEPGAAWPLTEATLADVVITGGSGALGRHFARYLARRGARRIVLLSRGGLDPAALADLTATGAEVIAPQCDLRSAEQLAAVAADHAGAGASLLIHAAGAATFGDHRGLTPAAFADTAAAKVDGLTRLLDHWPLRPDARILLCSSVSGLWGGRGHIAYAAANRLLDVLAGQLRAKGRHAVAVRYGLWRTDGVRSTITDRAGIAAIEAAGLVPMPPEDAIAASLRAHPGDPLVYAADQDRLRLFLRQEPVKTRHRPTDPTPAADPDPDTPAVVRAEVAAVLNLDAATLDLQTSLLDLGLDSLLALDLRKRLLRATGTSVPLATLLGGITGAELIAGLDTRSQKVETTRD